VGAHLGVWGFIPSHSFALLEASNVIPGFTFGLHLCKALPWSQAQGYGCDTINVFYVNIVNQIADVLTKSLLGGYFAKLCKFLKIVNFLGIESITFIQEHQMFRHTNSYML
jgi:hypothetical protein